MQIAGAAHPRLLAAYLAGLMLATALALWRSTPTPGLDPTLVGAAFALMCIAELAAVSLPAGGYASAGAAIDMASILLLGPAATAWLNLASTTVVQGLVRRRPPLKTAHNLAAFALTALAAGSAYRAAGGRVGALELPGDLPALAACGAVYLTLNSALVSLALGLTVGPDPWRAWQRSFRHSLLYHLSFLALGSLIAVVVVRAGPWALLLLVPPFLAARHAFRLYVGIRHDLKDFVRALAEVLDEVDPYTRQHSVRVAEYAVRIARGMRLAEREVEDLEYAALVHDLGKIGPQHQRILQKVGGLSHEDQRTLRGHPATGAGIIGRVRALRRAAEIVRLHHERPDGRGYPLGLGAEDTPIPARILNVADAFDAMTSDRPYRRALDLETALRELDRGAGRQFDRVVVDQLLRLRDQGRFPLIASPSSEELRLLRIHRPRVRA